MIISTLTVIAVGSLVVEQVQCARTVKNYNPNNPTSGSVVNGVYTPNCFPAVDFKMPNATPTSLTNWWCNTDAEYAFVGFSYDISPCNYFFCEINIFYMLTATSSGPNLTQLKTDFLDMRRTFKARYVRLYEACDNKGF